MCVFVWIWLSKDVCVCVCVCVYVCENGGVCVCPPFSPIPSVLLGSHVMCVCVCVFLFFCFLCTLFSLSLGNSRTLELFVRSPPPQALIYHIHKTSDEGAVLVFLPGLQSIRTLFSMLERPSSSSSSSSSNREYAELSRSLRVLPLHSSLSSGDQKLVFQQFSGKRKVVLSTNIAETSVTIDDVVYVVDTCRYVSYYYWVCVCV
jgi:Helicase conserved C-terminal domain